MFFTFYSRFIRAASLTTFLAWASLSCHNAFAQTLLPIANRLTASDGAANEYFGTALAVKGNIALIGNRSDTVGGASQRGSVYVFNTTTGAQTAKLLASGGVAGDHFGSSIAMDANLALIGTPSKADKGAVYLFDTTTNTQIRKFTASDGNWDDNFGSSVALSGNTALIGAFLDDGGATGAIEDLGSAYLFNVTTGTQIAKLLPTGAGSLAHFGSSVGLSGNTAVVGAYGAEAVYLFNATTGAQTGKLVANDLTPSSYFGQQISVSGNFALIGASAADTGGHNYRGAAYLFDITTGQQVRKFVASDGRASDAFGGAVALSGNTALIGATGATINGHSSQGAVYAFDITTGQQLAKYSSADGAVYDLVGSVVALDGTTGLWGTGFDDIESNAQQGSAYRFTVTNNGVAAPEPSVLALLTHALPLIGVALRRRKQSR